MRRTSNEETIDHLHDARVDHRHVATQLMWDVDARWDVGQGRIDHGLAGGMGIDVDWPWRRLVDKSWRTLGRIRLRAECWFGDRCEGQACAQAARKLTATDKLGHNDANSRCAIGAAANKGVGRDPRREARDDHLTPALAAPPSV